MNTNNKKAVILDRDGTLIVDKVYLNDPTQIEYLPGVFEGMRLLRDLGYCFAIATNQSGVARGIVQLENLHRIHELIAERFAKEGVSFLKFYYAPYSVESGHPMRKPKPGMLTAAAEEFNLDLKSSWMIGDRWSDVDAGIAAGTRTILLKGVETDFSRTPNADIIADDFMQAAKFIQAQTK